MTKKCLPLFLCLIAANAWGATGTLVPTGDNTTGGWASTPLFEKVDEDIDSLDGLSINSPNNPGATNDLLFNTACPSDVDTITEANLRANMFHNGGSRQVSCNLSWSATTATNVATGNLTTTHTEYSSGNQTGLSISKSTCDASTFTISCSTTGSGSPGQANLNAFNIDITYTAAAGDPNPDRERRVIITITKAAK